MKYDFLIETYETERVKVVSAWSMFQAGDLPVRPNQADARGRSFHEHMVHQCVSENLWFRDTLAIDVGAPPLPKEETRLEFMKQYAEDSGKRLAVRRAQATGVVGGEGGGWVGGRDHVLRRPPFAGLGDDAPHDAYLASSGTTAD